MGDLEDTCNRQATYINQLEDYANSVEAANAQLMQQVLHAFSCPFGFACSLPLCRFPRGFVEAPAIICVKYSVPLFHAALEAGLYPVSGREAEWVTSYITGV